MTFSEDENDVEMKVDSEDEKIEEQDPELVEPDTLVSPEPPPFT